jgi:predicted RNase H-like HicB family nuclease
MYRVLVVISRTETGFCAYAPDVPGCVAAGDTLEETEELMHEALEMHLEDTLAQGEPAPELTSVAAEFFMVRLPGEKSSAA